MPTARYGVLAFLIVSVTGCGQAPAALKAADEPATAAVERAASVASASAGEPAVAPADASSRDGSPSPAAPAVKALVSDTSVAHSTTLPRGTRLAVRLGRSLSTARDNAGDTFTAELDTPVIVDGKEILPRGTPLTGHVTTSDASGRLKGRAQLTVTLDAVDVDGHRYQVHTSSTTRTSAPHKDRNIKLIGGGTGVGALVGGIAGGGKGAGIGAAIGAGAGTGAAAATGKQHVSMSAEAPLRFTLQSEVTVAR